MGFINVILSEKGILMVMLLVNVFGDILVIGFIFYVDILLDCSGKNVNL